MRRIYHSTSFMATQMAEAYYGSARNFLYQMNRLSGEEWLSEQKQDGNGVNPIGLADMEPSYQLDLLLKNETGRNYRPDRLTDFEVCGLIDDDYATRFGVSSVYHLTDSQKKRIYKELLFERHLPEQQIRRCIGF